jgi:hypothetical protein
MQKPSAFVRACAALLLSALLCACVKTPEAPDPTPQGVVKGFYDWRIHSQMTGAPDAQQLAEMQPYISAELHELLAKVRPEATDAKPAKKKKQRGKRAFAEGDLFSSIFDGPTTFKIDDVATQGADQFVPVTFTSAKQLPSINWVDRVKVINENGHYVVADIEYASHWEFGVRATLIDALQGKTPPRKIKSQRG